MGCSKPSPLVPFSLDAVALPGVDDAEGSDSLGWSVHRWKSSQPGWFWWVCEAVVPAWSNPSCAFHTCSQVLVPYVQVPSHLILLNGGGCVENWICLDQGVGGLRGGRSKPSSLDEDAAC